MAASKTQRKLLKGLLEKDDQPPEMHLASEWAKRLEWNELKDLARLGLLSELRLESGVFGYALSLRGRAEAVQDNDQ